MVSRPMTQSLKHLVLTLLLCFLETVHADSVRAELSANDVPAGEAVQFAIIVEGANAGDPVMPEVKDLTVQFTGRQQQFSLVNGQTSAMIRYGFIVGSSVPGVYQIPAITLDVGGQKMSTQPLTLTVRPNGQAAPGMDPKEKEKIESDPHRFGFLTVEMANQKRKHAYIGEIAPVKIRAWLPLQSQAELRSGIQPQSQGFTLHNVNNRPDQTREIRDGKQYLVVTWFGGISAAKAGTHPASLSLKARVAVPDVSKQVLRQQRVPMIEKDVTLTSDDQLIEVRPLPTEGRPADFQGAVGEFQFDAIEIPQQWNIGEPQKVAVRMAGSGNFANLKAPIVAPAGVWKMYDGQDQFTPGDNASFAGTKVFQYNAIPKRNGTHDAHFQLSYFDPDLEKYQTIQSRTQSVTINGEEVAEEEEKPSEAVVAPPQQDNSDQVAALKAKPSARRDLRAWSDSNGFLWHLLIATTVLLSGPLWLWSQAFYRNPARLERLRLQAVTRSAMDQAQQCAQSGDVAGFFASGRQALQHQLAALWKQSPQAITLADAQGRLPADAPVIAFFREADRCAYGMVSHVDSLPQWQSLLQQSLLSLTSVHS